MKKPRITIKVDRPKLTGSEIRSRQEFHRVLTSYRKMTQPLFRNPKLLGMVILIAIVTALLILVDDKKDKPPEKKPAADSAAVAKP